LIQLQVGGTPNYPWTSAKVLAPLLLSTILLLPLFILVETWYPDPLIPLRLFRIRNFIFTMIFTFGLGASFFTVTIFLPQRMQLVNGLSPVKAGVRMLPQLVFLGVLSPIASRLVVDTMSYRPLMVFSGAIGAIGTGLLSTLTVATNFPQQYGFEVMTGCSIGVTITVSTIIVQFSTEREHLAAATGFQSFVRQLGGLVGIAVATAILNARVTAHLDVFKNIPSSPLSSRTLRDAITQNPAGLLGMLDPTTMAYVREAYSDGFAKLFIGASGWFVIATISAFFLTHIFPDELVRRAIEKKGNKGNNVLESNDVREKPDAEKGAPATGNGVPSIEDAEE
jgi:hypothetical protein